jgi:hypothetical protein
MNITQLPDVLNSKDKEFHEQFAKIFRVSSSQAQLRIPETMNEWIVKQFGDVGQVENHQIVRIDNLITFRGALYNALRALRPQTQEPYDLAEIEEESKKPPFDKPYELTPEDVFGRIEGKHAVTGSNVAKYDGWHGVIIFNEPHPLQWTPEQLVDYFEVARRWFAEVHKVDSAARYPLFIWNCLWKAAASIVHGHAQVLVAKDQPYQEIQFLRQVSKNYDGRYFDEYFNLHQELDLAWITNSGIKVLLPLDQQKEREVQLWGKSFDDQMAKTLQQVLVAYRDQLGVQSFNVVAYQKPLTAEEGWDHMPVILRLVDRGKLSTRNADIGVMERFAGQQIIENDPYKTAEVVSTLFN